jgi:hypothetical protein
LGAGVEDPAGNAREEEVVVRYGATGSEAGVLAAVVAGALVARWAMLGWRERSGRQGARGSKGLSETDGSGIG